MRSSRRGEFNVDQLKTRHITEGHTLRCGALSGSLGHAMRVRPCFLPIGPSVRVRRGKRQDLTRVIGVTTLLIEMRSGLAVLTFPTDSWIDIESLHANF